MSTEEKMQLKNKLKQLTDINKEIKDLESKINRTNRINKCTDVVEGSSRQFPYTKHSIKLLGKNIEVATKLEQYNDILEKRLLDLLEIKTEVELFINKIPESRIRRIIEYRDIEGLSWIKIALKMGGTATSDSIRMEYNRFFKNI